uniref:NADPH-dependent FMN reductase n=1 Tax=Streptomyces calvus TaxID=67282 RepID=UPI003513C302
MAADRALTVLGLGGSTRAGSAAERLLRTALDAAGREGMATELFALGHRDVPVFHESLLLDPPPVVAELLAAVRRADAVVFCTPVYHGTVAGALKNAVDHLQALAGDDRPWLTGKAAALMAVGGTPSAAPTRSPRWTTSAARCTRRPCPRPSWPATAPGLPRTWTSG